MSGEMMRWDIGEEIKISLFVGDPDTGLGLTGQAGNITLHIRRASDDYYWTGTTWLAGITNLTMTEFDATNFPGLYIYALNGTVGNPAANVYYAHARIDNAPTVQGDDYSIHVSSDISYGPVYESEPEFVIRSS